jgi:hypothetical protein
VVAVSEDPLWTIPDLARASRESRRTIERRIAAGEIEVEHLSARAVRIRPDEVRRYLHVRGYDFPDHKPDRR